MGTEKENITQLFVFLAIVFVFSVSVMLALHSKFGDGECGAFLFYFRFLTALSASSCVNLSKFTN